MIIKTPPAQDMSDIGCGHDNKRVSWAADEVHRPMPAIAGILATYNLQGTRKL